MFFCSMPTVATNFVKVRNSRIPNLGHATIVDIPCWLNKESCQKYWQFVDRGEGRRAQYAKIYFMAICFLLNKTSSEQILVRLER